MGIFDDATADDGRYTFTDVDAIGAESVTYTPSGGTGLPFNIMVDRLQPDLDEDTAGPQMEIWVANSSVVTVGVSSVTVGGDTVTLPQRVGGSNITLTVDDIIDQDGGMWHLLVK